MKKLSERSIYCEGVISAKQKILTNLVIELLLKACRQATLDVGYFLISKMVCYENDVLHILVSGIRLAHAVEKSLDLK